MITPLDSVTDGARPPGSTSSDPAARHAGARFQTLVEQLPAIVWTATLDNVTTYVSPQVERILGTPVDIWLSDPTAWERHIHPADRERVTATLAAARHADVPFRAEYRLVRADGRIVWVLDQATVVRDDAGQPIEIQGVALDITERKQAEAEAVAREREHRALRAISEIGRAGLPTPEAYCRITTEIVQATGFPMAAIMLLDEARGRLVYRSTHGLPNPSGDGDVELDLDATLSDAVVRTGRTLVWTDDEPALDVVSEAVAAWRCRTFLGVPMTLGGAVIGVLALADRRRADVDARLAEFVATIASHLCELTDRARSYDALLASERHFRAVFDGAMDAMTVLDDSGTYVAANPAAARLFGAPVEAIVGRRFGAFSPPQADVAAAWEELRTGRATTGAWRLQAADGSVKAVEYSVGANFQPGRHLVVCRDVTERRGQEGERHVLSAALQATADGVVITDPAGRIEWVNPAFGQMTGYTLDEVRGRTPNVLKSGQHDPALYQRLWQTIQSGETWSGEMVNRRKDGTLYHEEQTITPIVEHAEGGRRIVRFVGVKHDVTERRQAEEALRRSEEYHRSLMDNALDLVVILERTGVVRYASPSMERLLGYRPDEIVGTSSFDRIHPDDRAPVGALLQRGAVIPGFTASIEYRIRHHDGSYRWFEAIASNLLDHPAVSGIIVNGRDITERKEAAAAQEQLRAHLRHSEKLAAMSELLAGVAHELNNPLSVVIGHTALLARNTDPKVAARAEQIGRAATRCGRIVKNFLALARQYPPERSTVSLNEVVRDALEIVAYPLRVDGIEVVTELDPGLARLSADPHQLQQVVVNLVTNAHHALRGASGARRLTIRSGAVDAAVGPVWLEVEDTGPGIPPEVEARLFEPFFTTKPVGQGTGLGLSICMGIIEGHDGRLTVQGRPGQGAIFRTELPLGSPATPAVVESDGPVGRPRRILVVDDEAEMADVMSEILSRDGHEVETASNGVEALARLQGARWDLVVSDIKMPKMDGPALWAAVEATDPDLARRFVFFTGDTLGSGTAKFLEQTGAPSIRKPFTLRDVRAALAKVPDAAKR